MDTTMEEITENVIILLKEFIKDWGLDDEISTTTTFKDDLCFSSVDM
jgi:acyl carrier protein